MYVDMRDGEEGGERSAAGKPVEISRPEEKATHDSQRPSPVTDTSQTIL